MYPETVVIWFFFFNTFNTFVDLIISPFFLFKTTKYPLSVIKKILFPFIIGVFADPIFFSQFNWPVSKLNENVEFNVERIISLSNTTISEDSKMSVSWA